MPATQLRGLFFIPVSRGFLVAWNAKCPAIANLKHQLREVSESFYVIWVKLSAAMEAKLASVIISFEHGIPPFFPIGRCANPLFFGPPIRIPFSIPYFLLNFFHAIADFLGNFHSYPVSVIAFFRTEFSGLSCGWISAFKAFTGYFLDHFPHRRNARMDTPTGCRAVFSFSGSRSEQFSALRASNILKDSGRSSFVWFVSFWHGAKIINRTILCHR